MKKRGAKEKGYKEICCLVCGMLELIEPATTHTWLPLFASFFSPRQIPNISEAENGVEGMAEGEIECSFPFNNVRRGGRGEQELVHNL